MKPEITFHANNLSCVRQRKLIFKKISFELKQGELLLIEGANGSGKSSLLRLLAGLATPFSGEVLWQGKSIKNRRTNFLNHLHYISHLNGVKLGLTVEENLRLANYFSLVDNADLTSVLSSLDLNHLKDTQANYLSAGQKRRIALAKLFLFPKLLWILDEPFTALDKQTQTFLSLQLEQHAKNGGMAILSSHHSLEFRSITAKTLRLVTC